MGLHCGTLGLQLGTLGVHFGVFYALWETLGGHVGTLGLQLEHTWAPFELLLTLWGVALEPFGHFGGKYMKKVPKVLENGSQNPDIFNDISTLCAKWQTAFGSRRRGRIEVWASCFHALGVHWRSLFLLLVFDVFWGPPGASFHGVGGRGGAP